jgi:trypsin-like peptidase
VRRAGFAAVLLVSTALVADAPAAVPSGLRAVSSGVVPIRALSCSGRPLRTGTGFLVGTSVVMTTRHVLDRACTVSVTVGGASVGGRRFVSWSGDGVSAGAADLATLTLDRAARNAHVFTFRSSSPATGATLGTAGFLLGTRLLTGGAVVWKGVGAGVPLLAVGVGGSSTADGAPLLDASGKVVGIVQKARGSRDVGGRRTTRVSEALDLSRWWGAKAGSTLCRAYPKGGVPGCSAADADPSPAPAPTPSPAPSPTPVSAPETQPDDSTPETAPGPPRAPNDYAVKSCWVQYTGDAWSAVDATKAAATLAAADLLARGPGSFWSVIRLTDGAPAAISGVTASLVSPTGFVSSGTPFTWDADDELAARPLDWQLTATGQWFFQNPLYSTPQQWAIRWSFPNGQSCDARFTVT